MNVKGPFSISIASGCLWALIAVAVAFIGNLPRITVGEAAVTVVGGMLAAPFIGLLMGLVSRLFRLTPRTLRILIAGGSLYVAVFLFLIASGLFSAAWSGRTPPDLWFNSLAVAWASLVWTWFFVVLWPLAYANHVLVAHAWDRKAHGIAG
jgi:hypothetical protein